MGQFNVASYVEASAKKHPQRKAVVFPEKRNSDGSYRYSNMTFEQLHEDCNRYAHGLYDYGLRQGMKVLLFVKPGLEFLSLTYALYKIGAVPVLIDPGMGKGSFLDCIKSVNPDAMVGIPKAHIAKLIYRKYFKSVKYSVTVGPRLFWPGKSLKAVRSEKTEVFPDAKTDCKDLATIVFTTGSTGIPKGVCYFHEQMAGQVEAIKEEFNIGESDVDFPIFPLFALFSVAWGITAVIPDMDPTKPAQAVPADIVRGIKDHGATVSIGSPALWKNVASWCAKNDVEIPSMKYVMMVGAPIRPETLKDFRKILPNGDAYTPYGATEALPIANISGSEILDKTGTSTDDGGGTCVGRPFPGITFGIIKISDEVIETMTDDIRLPVNEVGEVVVSGPIVTKQYFNRDEATKLAKIYEGDTIWHRMGDVGYIDDEGRLWFCGRKAHRVVTEKETLFSVCCEGIFNKHPEVYRSALVGVKIDGKTEPVILIEKEKNCSKPFGALVKELEFLGQKNEKTKSIQRFMEHQEFPVDIRHNAKIFREKLTVWAQQKIDRG
jgi:acyl-CoA synthetase (AMP-forming)/AMP-acid ligase II